MKCSNCNANTQLTALFYHRWFKPIGVVLAIALVLLAGWGLFSYYLKGESPVWDASNISIAYLEDSTKYVTDPEHLLAQDFQENLDTANFYLDLLNHELGVQNAFIIVNHVKNGDAFRMAYDVGNLYGVGDKATNTGLVVVIAVKDRSFGIATGKGLEEFLPDNTCYDIAENHIKANMRAGKTGPAVAETSKAIYKQIKDSKSVVSKRQ